MVSIIPAHFLTSPRLYIIARTDTVLVQVDLLDSNEELALVLAARAGSVEAFARLYGSYYAHMTWLAYAILMDQDLAEDAAQEAFAQACRKLLELRDPQRFATWLGRICQNQAYRLARNRARSNRVQQCSLAHTVDDTDLYQEAVSKAVQALPPMYRQVVVLFYYNQLSYQQIHQILGISVDKVKGRLHRARSILADRLKKLGFE